MVDTRQLSIEDMYDWADNLVDKARELISTVGYHDAQTEKWKRQEAIWDHEYGKYLTEQANARD